MGANQSNLSLPKFGYDMVVSITQASINATMKQFLDTYKGKDFVVCYIEKKDPNTNKWSYVQYDFEKLKKEVGIDPFSLPDAIEENEYLRKLYDLNFAFAFKTDMGLPDFDLEDIPDIITLNKGNKKVSYNLICREFEILNLEERRREIRWTHLKQSDEEMPWVFGFEVDLNLRNSESAFQYLPETIKQKVKNMNTGNMFSVQQLYADLNTIGLETTPIIKNLDTKSQAYFYLKNFFIDEYFKNLKAKNTSGENPEGDFLLGYSIKPATPETSSIAPTDLDFMISPYLDTKGNATLNYSMYTLNYLIMTESHAMPTPIPFTWNWIENSQRADFNGVMAIKKSNFVTYLNKLFSHELNTVCLTPSCIIKFSSTPTETKFNFKLNNTNEERAYKVVNGKGSHILTYEHYKSSSSSSKIMEFGSLLAGSVNFNYGMNSNIYLEGNKIRCTTKATAYAFLEFYGSSTEANVVDYFVETNYILGVDAYGNLTVAIENGKPSITNNAQEFSGNFIFDTFSKESINTIYRFIKAKARPIETFLMNHEQTILRMLNGSGVWIFPGGKTFAFKDVCFSESLDLVSNITYVDPNNSKAFEKR